MLPEDTAKKTSSGQTPADLAGRRRGDAGRFSSRSVGGGKKSCQGQHFAPQQEVKRALGEPSGCRREAGLSHPTPFLTATRPKGWSGAAAVLGVGGSSPPAPTYGDPQTPCRGAPGPRFPPAFSLLATGTPPALPFCRLQGRVDDPEPHSRAGLVPPTRGTATQTGITGTLRGQPQPRSPPLSCSIAHPASPEAPAPCRELISVPLQSPPARCRAVTQPLPRQE